MHVGARQLLPCLLLPGGDADLGERCFLASLRRAAPLLAGFCLPSAASLPVLAALYSSPPPFR